MPKYSRSAKYEELRSSLQSDSEAGLHTPDLSQYEQRLNKIAPTVFEAPNVQAPETLNPVRARRAATYTQPEQQQPAAEQAPVSTTPFSQQMLKSSNVYTTGLNNEYINEYLNEVKKYNVEQGNALSANTDLDILRGLRGETPKAPTRPYPDEEPVTIKPLQQERVKEEAVKAVKSADTADISFPNKPQSKAEVKRNDDYIDDDYEDDDETDEYTGGSDTRPMSKDDIAAEVQRLINGQQQKREKPAKNKRKQWLDDTDETQYEYYDDRSTHQQLLNETTQMRAQMDDYEDNLNDVNDKMRHTNQILNIVLIILIIALALVLAVVIYWVLVSKGVLS